jgi:hypothetical protein
MLAGVHPKRMNALSSLLAGVLQSLETSNNNNPRSNADLEVQHLGSRWNNPPVNNRHVRMAGNQVHNKGSSSVLPWHKGPHNSNNNHSSNSSSPHMDSTIRRMVNPRVRDMARPDNMEVRVSTVNTVVVPSEDTANNRRASSKALVSLRNKVWKRGQVQSKTPLENLGKVSWDLVTEPEMLWHKHAIQLWPVQQ